MSEGGWRIGLVCSCDGKGMTTTKRQDQILLAARLLVTPLFIYSGIGHDLGIRSRGSYVLRLGDVPK